MIEVDRLMIEDYQIDLVRMMENAGRCLAITGRDRFLAQDPVDKRILVVAGTGGNGGGALVAARRLHNWGARVEVFLSSTTFNPASVPAHQLAILRNMRVPVYSEGLPSDSDWQLILDGLIGYSLKGAPYGRTKDLIEWINQQQVTVLSLDTPSGLDLTSGTVFEPTVQANATLTLALPKQGLFDQGAKVQRGELYLGDISVPPGLYQSPSLDLQVPKNLFAQSDIIRLE